MATRLYNACYSNVENGMVNMNCDESSHWRKMHLDHKDGKQREGEVYFKWSDIAGALRWLKMLCLESVWRPEVKQSLRTRDHNSNNSCHLLYYSESESCSVVSDPIDYTVHGIVQARILEWVACSFSRGSSLTQGLNLSLLNCRRILTNWSYQGSPTSHLLI